MTLRLRIRELMKAHGYATAYELAQAMKGRVGERTVYRLVEADGTAEQFSATTLEALAETFGVDVGDLFDRSRRRA